MQYKIAKVVIPAETSSIASSKTEEACSELEAEVQGLIDLGWELAGGANISATKLGHIMMTQTLIRMV